VGQLSDLLALVLDDNTPGVSVRDVLVRFAAENNIPV
jgi:phosphotransferase system enzyme I (PtsP)